MSAPTSLTIIFYPGADPAPNDNTSPIIGAIDTGTALSGSSNTVINSPEVTDAEQTFYGGLYCKNTSTGNLANARISNRAGSILNSASATAQIVSSSSSDTGGMKVRITGLASAVLTSDELEVDGTTPVAGAITFDANSIYICEVLSSIDSPVTPLGNITISVDGEIIGVIYGSGVKPTYSCNMVTSLFTMAVATSKSTTISASNRLSAPSSTGSYYSAVKWAGNDSSVPVPSNNLDADEYIGIAVKLVIPENLSLPEAGYFRFLPYIVGNAEA